MSSALAHFAWSVTKTTMPSVQRIEVIPSEMDKYACMHTLARCARIHQQVMHPHTRTFCTRTLVHMYAYTCTFCMHTFVCTLIDDTCVNACRHTHTHTHINTRIYNDIHTYIHTYIDCWTAVFSNTHKYIYTVYQPIIICTRTMKISVTYTHGLHLR